MSKSMKPMWGGLQPARDFSPAPLTPIFNGGPHGPGGPPLRMKKVGQALSPARVSGARQPSVFNGAR